MRVSNKRNKILTGKNATVEDTILFLYGKNPALKELASRLDLHTQVDVETCASVEGIIKAHETKNKTKTKPMALGKKTGTATKKAEAKNSNKAVYAEGIAVFTPHVNAPEFVLAEIYVNPDKFGDWLDKNADCLREHPQHGNQLKLTVKKAENGTVYAQVDVYGTGRAEK